MALLASPQYAGRRADGRYYVAVFPYPGGYGGSAASDGLVNGTLPSPLAGFMSVEMSEHRYPIRFEHLSVREDSSGPGRNRGGCASSYAITTLAYVVLPIVVSILILVDLLRLADKIILMQRLSGVFGVSYPGNEKT